MCGKIEIYSDEPVFPCSDKFLIREKSDCIPNSGDTHSYGESLKAGREEIQNPTQRRVHQQTTIPQVLNCYWKEMLQMKANLVLQSWSNPASRKFMRRSSKFRRTQCTIQKKLFLLEKGSGMIFLPTNLSKETLFQPKSQNLS